MGMGSYSAGKFELYLSLRFNADTTKLAEWRLAYQHASEMLFAATEGQQQFGTIHVANNSTGGDNADAWLYDFHCTSGSPPVGIGLGKSHEHSWIYCLVRFRPFVLVHEFGHYAYGLDDEYWGPGGLDKKCIDSDTDNACFMQFGWKSGDRFGDLGKGGPFVAGRVNQFCVASNHDPRRETWQTHNHNCQSCWETMKTAYNNLTIPPHPPSGPPPSAAASIEWVMLELQRRFVLALDRSSSSRDALLTEAKVGATWWADTADLGDRIGLVSFANTATDDFPLRTIESDKDRAALRGAIAKLTASNGSTVGNGLRVALDQILKYGPRAASQTIVLLSDGVSQGGEPPDQVLPEIRANGVNVFTIGAGSDIDAELLARIARVTGGTFFRVDPERSPDEQAYEVRTAFQEIAGLAHENTGAIDVASLEVPPGGKLEHAVHVETGSRLATFALSWMHAHDRVRLKLVSPLGATITIESPVDGVDAIFGQQPFVGFKVSRPAPGKWLLQIEPEHLAAPTAVRLFVFSANPVIAGAVNASRHHYKPGESILLQLHTYFNGLVRGVRVQARVHAPGGTVLPLEFHDDGNRDTGDLIPDDGDYHAVFSATKRPGVYTIEAAVTSDGESASRAEAPSPDDDEPPGKPMPIPPFRRVFKTSVLVGEEPRLPQVRAGEPAQT